MEDFAIYVNEEGQKCQTFNGKIFKQYIGAKYFTGLGQYMHRYVYKKAIGKIPKFWHVHHKDGNPENNKPYNLQAIEPWEHISAHAKSRFLADPVYAAKLQKAGFDAAVKWHTSLAGITSKKEKAMKLKTGEFNYGVARCAHCSKKFLKKQGAQIYCNSKCKGKACYWSGNNTKVLTCNQCGKDFTCDKHNDPKTCSRICGAKNANIKKAEKRALKNNLK